MKATKTKNTSVTAGSLAIKKAIGAGNVASYALNCLLSRILNREAAENLGRSDKATHQHSQYIISGQAARKDSSALPLSYSYLFSKKRKDV